MNDKNFNIPKNIKQIGNLDQSLKVYIEDYAFTFMQQCSKENQDEDKIALLIGEECNIDDSNVLFISGVIKPKYTTFKNSMEILTEKSFDYIQEQIDIYFPSLKVVGWFYSRTGFEKEISPSYIKYHKENFFNDNKVLFLNDPLEKTGTFFKFCQDNDNFIELKGFIIYYERNEAMSEYMLNNQFLSNPELEEKRAKEATLKSSSKVQKIDKKAKDTTSKELKQPKETQTTTQPKKVTIENKKSIENKRNIESKKSINIFGSLTAVLLLVSFVMGAGLIQNEDRITKLETQLNKIDETYKYLLLQVTNESVQNVFAETTYSDFDYEDGNNSYAYSEINLQEEQSSYQEQENLQLESSDNENNSSTQQYTLDEQKGGTELIQQQTSYDKLQEKQNYYTQNNVLEDSYETYVIKDGDSLEKISRQFYGNTEKISEIMDINQIEDADKIYSGMSIKLP